MPSRWYRSSKLAVWALFAFAGCSVLARCLYQVIAHGWVWSGAFGYTADGMQYLGFVREASRHLLIGNPFATEVGTRVFLHPMLGLSGGLAWLGLPIPYAFALWMPVGVISVVWGATRAVESAIPASESGPRIVALILGLGYAFRPDQLGHIPLGLKERLSFSVAEGDAWPMRLLFGWPLGAVSTGLLAVVLAGYWTKRTGPTRSGTPWLLCIGAFLCSWIQPWPGLTLIAAVVAAELVSRIPGVLSNGVPRPTGWRTPALLLASATCPLIYYALLDRLESGWALSGVQLVALTHGTPWWALWLPLAPLLLLAPLAWRTTTRDFRLVMLTTWSLAGLLGGTLILESELGNVPQHMLRGLSIPLATLSVIGVAHATRSWPGASRVAISGITLLALVVIPGTMRLGTELSDTMNPVNQRFIAPGEAEAFKAISNSQRAGGVLAPGPLGAMVPWRTGRVPWVGHRNLTPDYNLRSSQQSAYVNGFGLGASTAETQKFFKSHGFAFVLIPCSLPVGTRLNLIKRLGGQVARTQRFECAYLLTLR
ncbi:MAG: hypothetical protein WCI34_00435 [Actinomycetes bacterium]